MLDFFHTLYHFFITPLAIGNLSFSFSLANLVLRVVLPLILYSLAFRLLGVLLRFILRKLRITEATREIVSLWGRRALRLIYLVAVVLTLFAFLGAEVMKYLGLFFQLLRMPLLTSGKTSISITTLLLLIPAFYVASWAGKKARQLVDHSFFQRLGLDAARRFSVGSLVRYAVIILVLLFFLTIIGIDLSAIGVLLGVLGIGVGFGLQDIVSNFFAGLVIISSRPVKENDRIVLNGYEGTIKHIRMLSTVVTTLDNENIIFPNSKIVNDYIFNYSYENREVLIRNTVQVSYNADIDLVFRIFARIALDNPWKSRKNEATTRILSFDDSGISVELRVLLADIAHKPDAVAWNNYHIWKRFKENEIEIPFPQMDLHVKRDSPDLQS